MLSPNNLLLPLQRRDESATKLLIYWQTIFSGSKRYIGESGLAGDNTDVRPPADDESGEAVWAGVEAAAEETVGNRSGKSR
jgi:hypothetical protein